VLESRLEPAERDMLMRLLGKVRTGERVSLTRL
jgi:hypothetical protein